MKWLHVIFNFLNALDGALTYYNVGCTGRCYEANPIPAFIINHFGWFIALSVKLFFGFILSYYVHKKLDPRWAKLTVLIIGSLIMFAVCVSNYCNMMYVLGDDDGC